MEIACQGNALFNLSLSSEGGGELQVLLRMNDCCDLNGKKVELVKGRRSDEQGGETRAKVILMLSVRELCLPLPIKNYIYGGCSSKLNCNR